MLKYFGRHVDPFEKIVKLLCAAARVPGTFKGRQMLVDFVERYAIASIISARGAEGHLAARKHVADDLRDLLDAIVVIGVTHVEGLVMHGLNGRLQDGNDRLCDIYTM